MVYFKMYLGNGGNVHSYETRSNDVLRTNYFRLETSSKLPKMSGINWSDHLIAKYRFSLFLKDLKTIYHPRPSTILMNEFMHA